MKLTVSLPFRNGWAYFTITQEGKAVYIAQLEQYEGKSEDMPPVNIVVTKSFRRWRGSADDQNLIDHLGQVIEERLSANSRSFQTKSSSGSDV